jgi:DNA-binding NarL/FixJ family response regulator
MAGDRIGVVVADDHQVVRAGFAALLGTQRDFVVLGTAADGAEAVSTCRSVAPDVVLMDVRMPGVDGIEATRRLMAADFGAPAPKVLILTTFDLDEYVFDALRAGASGFLLKDVTAERLFEGVRIVAAGEALLAPGVTRRLISEFARLPAAGDAAPPGAGNRAAGQGTLPLGAAGEAAAAGAVLRGGDAPPASASAVPRGLAALTPRETEVLRLVAEGLSNTEIARRLVVTEETVKTHVSRLLAKLGLRDRTQAVVTAYESGLVVPGGMVVPGGVAGGPARRADNPGDC